MKIFYKAVLPAGFRAAASACGLKKNGKTDLALFYSVFPAATAAVFTANKMVAAPVVVCKEHLKKCRSARAIIANSGNANCFTGDPGLEDARNTAGVLSRCLKIKKESVLVCSTGVIGKPLDFPRIAGAVPELACKLSPKGIDQAKRAIMTTDKFPKEVTAKFKIGSREVTVCGVAKGAGMIAPDMATMFAFIFTDAAISGKLLPAALKAAVRDSFNCLTVDGCMSTNDTVILMANGCAGNPPVEKAKDLKLFQEALNLVCLELARMMARDGEGASKFIEIKVEKARTYAEAKKAAMAVANYNLFKCAVYGENPNFGRIVAAVGACGIAVKEKDLKIDLGDLKKKEIKVTVSLGRGKASCTVYTSDLTPGYIKINAAYN